MMAWSRQDRERFVHEILEGLGPCCPAMRETTAQHLPQRYQEIVLAEEQLGLRLFIFEMTGQPRGVKRWVNRVMKHWEEMWYYFDTVLGEHSCSMNFDNTQH